MSAATLQVACFRVAGFDCAVDIMTIAEVLGPADIARLPAAPVFVEGMIEVRGRFLPVIDLRRRLVAAERAPTTSHRMPFTTAGGAVGAGSDSNGRPAVEGQPGAGKLLVAPLSGTRVALRVDEVTGVERIPEDEIQPPPAVAVPSTAPALVVGVARRNQRVLLILDLAAVLSSGERAALAGFDAPPPE